MPLTWKSDTLKKALLADLTANADIVGEFVESEARRRVLAIPEPAWGAGHRKYISRLLTNVVEQERNAVVIRVGLPPGKKTKTGTTRHLGFYIEFGSKTAPAHPYLRPAVYENAANIVALLSGK